MLDTIEVVIHAGKRVNNQRSGDARQLQRGAQLGQKHVLDLLNSFLRIVKRKARTVALGNLGHGVSLEESAKNLIALILPSFHIPLARNPCDLTVLSKRDQIAFGVISVF